MKNLHSIFSDWDKKQVALLKKHGINIELGYYSFWIEENELYWKLKPYFDRWSVKETVVSKFTEEEENNTKRLVILSPWANGYPMPDDDAGYKKTTYNDSNYCGSCGVGLIQKEPFRLRKAPNWSGKKRIFSLNWIYDELFVRKDFYESLFRPLDIQSEPVLLYKKETVIDDTVQLIIPEAGAPLDIEGYPYQLCKNCNRKRYDLINKGFFPRFKENIGDMQIFKSKEWFGTGANARKYIFVSQSLRKEFLKLKVTANYIPCES
ncbi:hypothetical protein GCM10027051_32440 [Niabella terrae]